MIYNMRDQFLASRSLVFVMVLDIEDFTVLECVDKVV